ncbi:hypothetical protein PsorP6_005867 [Peronosclerospora sorghi]|uniref:Uncharacterized protein n=1 Tax=Peronosclerospora sorghi TaxID=230839 RepID=A0ACC0W587_9STRA|nr:hypothetical protein PsorP6_005867 [Peronosclerospora sorghi]
MNSNGSTFNRNDESSCSAMDGLHQRRLSLSAKWASDESKAIEYLRRQRDVMAWIERVLKRELPSTSLFESLKSGVVLRELMEILFPDASNCMSRISRRYSLRMAPWKERENISVFLRQCKSIGMIDLSLFCTDDLYEGTNMVQVLFCMQHFMMFAEVRAIHPFKPMTMSEPAEFSDQELELAMSKIERTGMALKGLISFDSSVVVPKTITDCEKEASVRGGIYVVSKEESVSNINEGRLEKIKLVGNTEIGNQMSEDKQDANNPLDDVNTELDSGSGASNENEAIQRGDAIAFVEKTSIVVPSAQNQEIKTIIQLVISEMVAQIDKTLTLSMMEQAAPTAAIALKAHLAIPLEEPLPERTALSTVNEKVNVASGSQVKSEVTQVRAACVELECITTTVNEAKVEFDNLVVDLTNIPMKSTEESIIAQSFAEIAEKAVEQQETATPQLPGAGIDQKAMTKCGSCMIM